jgi:hypothetical protein
MQFAYMDFHGYCKGRREDTVMNTHALNIGTNAQYAVVETEALAQSGFTQEEIACLLRLREWYQHGGSDRIDVIHHLDVNVLIR